MKLRFAAVVLLPCSLANALLGDGYRAVRDLRLAIQVEQHLVENCRGTPRARSDLMDGYHYPRWLLVLGILTCLLSWYMAYKSAGAIFSFIGAA